MSASSTFNEGFRVSRYDGNCRVGVFANDGIASLGVSTNGLDVSVFLNHGDLARLGDMIAAALRQLRQQEQADLAPVEEVV